MSGLRIISADDHLDLNTLPAELWQRRLPAGLRERGPRVIDTPEGPTWVCDGKSWGLSGAKRVGALIRAGMPEPAWRPSTPSLRLQDMDRDGIEAHVIYGSLGGLPVDDPALKEVCVRAYNDWTAEYDAAAPGRLCNLALLPNESAGAAAGELRRVAKLGHRGALFDHFASAKPVHDPYWDPLWRAADETGLPISLHLIGGTYSLGERFGTWEMPAFVSVAPLQLDEALAGLCFCGALERFPGLTIVFGEAGLGWLPYMLERMEEEYVSYGGVLKEAGVRMTPRQVFDRQLYVTFQKDDLGLRLLPEIGADNVLWASDYPHLDSTWPDSVAYIEQAFATLPEEDREKLLWRNAARAYRLAGTP